MGNYISIIVGCVGAVELITFLHEFSLRADQEHEQELEEEARQGRTTNQHDLANDLQLVDQSTKEMSLGSLTSLKEPAVYMHIPVEEPEILKTELKSLDRELSPRPNILPRAPEIRFELYERSCSLSEIDRPLVDGLKLARPLVRDDGSGRRKSVKKRNSSGSIDMKASREEELRMFTSLEEEEFSSFSEGGYLPISYTNAESSSGVTHPRRHRRFKRSPVKDSKTQKDEYSSSSHEVLDDIPLLDDPVDSPVTYPWGDIRQHRPHRRHLCHEKSMSIEELQEDEERLSTNDEVISGVDLENNGAFDGQLLSQSVITKNSGYEPLQGAASEGVNVEIEKEESLRSANNRIIVSIESEPNIDRLAQLDLHDLSDSQDDMTPVTDTSTNTALNFQNLADSTGVEETGLLGGEHVDNTIVDENQEADFLGLKDAIENRDLTDDTDLSGLVQLRQYDAVNECASEVTLCPDIINKPAVTINEHIGTQDNPKLIDSDSPIHDSKEDVVDIEETKISETYKKATDKTVTSESVPEKPIEQQCVTSESTTDDTIEKKEGTLEPLNITEEYIKTPSLLHVTTEESNNSVVDEDISNYDNFITIMQSNVLKEVTKGFQFPVKHDNKPDDFPKTMSQLITFDDEDMTDAEKKNLQLRKRQDSIRGKIQTENTTLRKKTGHHRRYNMPAHSIDMDVRLELSNKKLEDAKKVFPRNRQIFITGNFPRNISHESEYKLKDGLLSEPARVQRVTYTQPIVQLTMIREETPRAVSPIPPSRPSPPPPPPPVYPASQSVPTTPHGLTPHPIGLVRRARSVSPFIVDKDDPMMLLLKDSMEIPLVHDGNP